MDAVALEMAAVKVSFKTLDDGDNIPVGYQRINCHQIFDVKLDGFCQKARMVAGGHVTEVPAVMMYSSVVSRESVRIALTLAALNDLEVKASDIMNAYLMSPCEEKIWTVLGPEFGDNAGRKAILVRTLYGLKSAGALFS
jgi:Reverse transcriptase (RNA-dependent DNA polymerase)